MAAPLLAVLAAGGRTIAGLFSGGAAATAKRAIAQATQARQAGRMAAAGARAAAGGASPRTARRLAQNAAVQNYGSTAERWNSRLWATQSALDLASRVSEGTTPTFAHTIRVSVSGGPDADIRRIWYLCLSAAFGRYKRREYGYQGCQIDCVWDITGKAVSVELAYQNNGLSNAISVFSGTNGLNLIQEGPTQVTVGGTWPGWLCRIGQGTQGVVGGVIIQGSNLVVNGSIPGLAPSGNTPTGSPGFGTVLGSVLNASFLAGLTTPTAQGFPETGNQPTVLPTPINTTGVDPLRENQTAGRVATMSDGTVVTFANGPPKLPDEDRIITTGEKLDARIQNPRPPSDGISRGSLVALVSAYLGDPGVPVPKLPVGYIPPEPLGVKVTGDPVPGATRGERPTRRPDGYPYPPFFNAVPDAVR